MCQARARIRDFAAFIQYDDRFIEKDEIALKTHEIGDPCQITLANGLVELAVFPPSQQGGFYRGIRFDASGIVGTVACAGHIFTTPLPPERDPDAHDHVTGPAEEFSMFDPPGYAESPDGGPFIKIGVGVLIRPDRKPYQFTRRYAVLDRPSWNIYHDSTRIEFVQNLSHEQWGYRYSKRITLPAEKPILRIDRTLANTGRSAIRTDHYVHNFWLIDKHPLGPDYGLSLPFTPRVTEPPSHLHDSAVIHGNEIRFTRELNEDSRPLWALLGEGLAMSDNAFVLCHWPTGVQLAARGDRPPRRMVLYARADTLCIEPFITIDLAPGESIDWSTDYTFITPGR